MTDPGLIIGPIFAFAVAGLAIFFMLSKIKKRAEAKHGNLRQILGGGRWIFGSNTYNLYRRPHVKGKLTGLYFTSTFMGRDILCQYEEVIVVYKESISSFLEISSKPRNIPKKTSWHKFKYTNTTVYKDYVLSGDRVIVLVSGTNLPNEKWNEILEDLNRACEMVERGEYELN